MSVRFVPSRVQGVDGVREVEVHPDRLELHTDQGLRVLPLADFAAAMSTGQKLKGLVGLAEPRMVGVRDWFCAPAERYFRFAADPALIICMPEQNSDEIWTAIRETMAAGGFDTLDLG
jgi:hypothetical protein